ncbi:MAG TPA: hypothetical protein VGM65_03875 [Candidatus Udaeobacter sp.]|jgi:hypothetical protein
MAWLYFFTTGHLLWQRRPDNPQPVRLDTLVITSVAGMALSGFGLLLLGFAHLLSRLGFAGLLILEAAFFWLLKRDNWLSLIFWRRIAQEFVKGWTPPAFCIYLLFLALGLPAVLPPTSSDPIAYHLPYAADWANAGRIYVDPFLRFPYYANNFLLFDSAFFILKLGDYCHFLTWLSGLLTCLGVLAFFAPAELQSINDPPRRGRFPRLYQFLIAASVALSPVFLVYLNNGYVDVPIGLFILVAVLCAYKTLSHRSFDWELAVIAAFCVGMKLTLIGHLPFFVVSLLLASAHRIRPRDMALLVFALVGLSLPWYIRNLWEAHDPVPPILNFHFKHPDPIFTQADAAIYSTGKESDFKKPLHLLRLPLQYFIGPGQPPFGREGVSATFLFVYAPVIFLLVLFCFRKRYHAPKALVYLSVAAAYLALPWFYNPDGRHAIHWYPVLVAWVGVVISIVYLGAEKLASSRLATWTRIATAAFCCALIVPSPTQASVAFYRTYYAGTSDFARLGGNRKRYLEKNMLGYRASKAVIKTLKSAHKEQTHVLGLMVNPDFCFRKNSNIISVGDYFGPARYSDLFNETEKGEGCLSYMIRLNISAVITQRSVPSIWWPRFYTKFRTRLKECGYVEYSCGAKNIAIFLKSDIKPDVSLQPVP